MSYLEQSTRYVPYTQRPDGRWKYVVPGEIEDPEDRAQYTATLDRTFETYARWIEPIKAHYQKQHPREPGDTEGMYRSVIRAKALDTLSFRRSCSASTAKTEASPGAAIWKRGIVAAALSPPETTTVCVGGAILTATIRTPTGRNRK